MGGLLLFTGVTPDTDRENDPPGARRFGVDYLCPRQDAWRIADFQAILMRS